MRKTYYGLDDSVTWIRLATYGGDCAASCCMGMIHLIRPTSYFDCSMARMYMSEAVDRGHIGA